MINNIIGVRVLQKQSEIESALTNKKWEGAV